MGFLLVAYCMAPISQISSWVSCGTAGSWRMGESVSTRWRADGLIMCYSFSWTLEMEDARS